MAAACNGKCLVPKELSSTYFDERRFEKYLEHNKVGVRKHREDIEMLEEKLSYGYNYFVQARRTLEGKLPYGDSDFIHARKVCLSSNFSRLDILTWLALFRYSSMTSV